MCMCKCMRIQLYANVSQHMYSFYTLIECSGTLVKFIARVLDTVMSAFKLQFIILCGLKLHRLHSPGRREVQASGTGIIKFCDSEQFPCCRDTCVMRKDIKLWYKFHFPTYYVAVFKYLNNKRFWIFDVLRVFTCVVVSCSSLHL